MSPNSGLEKQKTNEIKVLTVATLRAAKNLGIQHKELAEVIGLSASMVSKMNKGNALLPDNDKTLEISKFFLRMYRSLDAIVGGSDEVAKNWLRNENTALNGVPIEQMVTIRGLLRVMAYLDQRRAPL